MIALLITTTVSLLLAVFFCVRSELWKQKALQNDDWAKFHKKCSEDWQALVKKYENQ